MPGSDGYEDFTVVWLYVERDRPFWLKHAADGNRALGEPCMKFWST